ncbi:MAG: MATE family efflux transporter, partial [Candidatus Ornithomonoglobus sp.]
MAPAAADTILQHFQDTGGGAEKYDRASLTMKTGILISFIIGTVMFTIVQLFPTQLMGFIVNDNDIIQTALPYLRVTAFDYLLVALIFPLNGLCNGSGHTMFTMIPSIFSSVIARVPVAYFCTRTLGLGLAGVGISTPTGTISAIIICTAYYLSGKWKNHI